MLAEATQRRPASAEVLELERAEAELWMRWQELHRRARSLEDTGNSALLKIARKDTSRAHVRHQRCLDLILRMHRDRLFGEARNG